MSTFSQEIQQARPALGRIILPPTAFMPTWDQRPHDNVCIGLTVISEGDIEIAKSAAATEAWQLWPRPADEADRGDTMQDLLLRWFVARGTCDPNDLTQPYELWAEAPEDVVREALTVDGARAIYDGIERLRIATSPVLPEADDDDIMCVAAVAAEALPKMPEWRASRIRRLLRFCLDEMSEHVDLTDT